MDGHLFGANNTVRSLFDYFNLRYGISDHCQVERLIKLLIALLR